MEEIWRATIQQELNRCPTKGNEDTSLSPHGFQKPTGKNRQLKQKEHIDKEERNQELLNLAETVLKKPRNMDEYEAYGITMAAKLRKMDNHQCLLAQFYIDHIVFNGLMGRLVEGSSYFYTSPNQGQYSSCSSQSTPTLQPSPTSYEHPHHTSLLSPNPAQSVVSPQGQYLACNEQSIPQNSQDISCLPQGSKEELQY